jgi:hypothetical protein
MYCEMFVGPTVRLLAATGRWALRAATGGRALLNVNVALTATWYYFTDFLQVIMNCDPQSFVCSKN